MTEEFKKLKEDTKKQSNELKESEFKENKCLTGDQYNKNKKLMEMSMTI